MGVSVILRNCSALRSAFAMKKPPKWYRYATSVMALGVFASTLFVKQHVLVDVFGGMQDLNHHLIRCVGDPEERFSEDALRILRAVRFSAQLNFPIESATADAIRKLAPNLQNISAERIQAELVKLLVSPHPERIRDAYELGLTKVILPEWDAMEGVAQNTPHHKYDVAEHTLRALKNVKRDKILRLTMLFHDLLHFQCIFSDFSSKSVL